MEHTKKMRARKIIIMILVVIMQVNLIPSVVYAGGKNLVEVSISAQKLSETYEAYSTFEDAEKNAIKLYVKEDEFPVYVTLYPSKSSGKKYEFDSYGTKQLITQNCGELRGFLGFIYAPIGGTLLWEAYAYATIEILPLQEEEIEIKAENETTPTEIELESEPKLTAIEKTELEARLQPLLDKIEFPYTIPHFYEEIKDFVLGNWDGSEKSDDDLGIWSSRCVVNRTYSWMGVNEFTGEIYKDIKINLDYLGSLDVVEGEKFTLAVDYSTGVIERWKFLEKEDSWNVDKGETINRIVINFSAEEDCLALAIVNTIDEENTEHMYFLKPNGEIQKIN